MFDKNTGTLVVDDSPTMRKLVIWCMKNLGFSRFYESSDGAQAWEKLNNLHPQVGLVLSDWNMPNMTGYDLLVNVRKDPKFKDLPFIMISGENNAEQAKKAIQANVDHFIYKPVSVIELKSKLGMVYKKYQK